MNKQFVLLFFIFINSISYTQSASKPKLIITITVDQLGEEVLSRYKDYYKNGLKKLLNEGVYYSNAMVDHAITNSLPGHTSIATGMLPRNHGLIDNMWGEISGDSVIQIMPTRSYQNRIVGYDSLWGYSPDYLEAKTLAQNISEANNESKIISVGSSVSAALHMGKQKGLAVWYHPPLAEYVSSDYYLGTLPIWLNKFNDQLKVKMNTDTVWNKKYSVGVSSAPIDERSFENNGKNFLFPHHSYESGDFYRWINATPFIDKYTTDLVIQSIINEKLGDDINTDFLSISYSMIDHVGHFFGPYSLEQFENLMSLDEQLGILIEFLDKNIGKKNYFLVLTADHGAVKAPEQAIMDEEKGYRITKNDIDKIFAKIKSIEELNLLKDETLNKIVAFLETQTFIQKVFTSSELIKLNSDDDIQRLYHNSFRQGRTPIYPLLADGWRILNKYGITIMPKKGISSYLATSIHGSPYDYDRKVPIIFYGAKIPLDKNINPFTIDIAPTILELLNIPCKTDGKSLIGKQE